ncbi:MAG TPA: hypothetical protein VGS57_13815 [Thermoanaerobaculia bacterium]|nr:hypothetical protein [Thermoanaerobaculia bacterium]
MSIAVRIGAALHIATLLAAGAAASPAANAAVPRCDGVAGNLARNCGFDKGVQGWRSQAVTTIAFDARHGIPAPGALRMTNQPASEAGASTCVVVPAATAFEVSGYLQRLDGPGSCLAFLEEHTTKDCSDGATAFHELANQTLVRGTFTQVHGSTKLRRDTVAVRAGFACYGEQDDDVQSVLLDNVTLRRVELTAKGGR